MRLSLIVAGALLTACAAFAADDAILLNTGAVDLARVPAPVTASAPFAGKRLHLVQFHDAVRPEWFAALAESGAEIVTYVPNNAYLVYGDAAALAGVHRLAASAPFVRAEAAYADSYKVQAAAQTEAAVKGRAPNDLYAVQLVQDAAANAATLALIDSVKLAPIQSQIRILKYLDVLVRLPPAALTGISHRPDVVSIRPFVVPRQLDERQDQIVAGNLTGNVPSGPGYLTWLTSKGFNQSQFSTSAFAVDVSDSGIDDGTTAPNHFAMYEGGVLGGTSRVIYNRLYGTPHANSTIKGCDGHGTLNAHIIGGYDDLAAAPHVDASGFHYGLGVAPFVRFGSSVIFDPQLYTFPDLPTLQSEAYHDGARISSNSWGAVDAGAYDVTAQIFDALTRDAQPSYVPFATPGNQQMIMVFAAGNEGPALQTIASPALAKNVLSVGAAENVQAFGGPDLCGYDDPLADSANDIATFSSRGPTADARRKPDLVAPGTHVSGGLIQSDTPGTTGQADACFTGSDVCGGPGSAFFPAGQQFFTASTGTSHSTPAVAGAAALLRQWFINQGLAPATPAMTRAYLVNSARFLTGDPADSRWSLAQGMGGVNLGTAFDGVPRMLRDEVPADTFTATGQTRAFAGTISDTSKPLRVTLAWTDAPGSTIGAAYNNNLDLSVTIAGTTYRGNVFSGPNSISGGTADAVNNLESVFLPAGISGPFAVTVKATNINSDGVPNSGGALDQDFALVVYNAVETPVAVIAAGTTQLDAEGCSPGNTAIDPGETVTVEFGLVNAGTAATANLVATLQTSGGVTNPGPPQPYGSVAPGATAFQPFVFTATGSCGGTLTATLHLQDGAADLGNVRFTFTLGTNAGGTQSTSNPASITIPDSGIASRYPSTIAVAGITDTVTKVTVTLNSFNHSFPDDVDMLLVGPQGQKVMLMSDAGGGLDLTAAQITIDDAAPFRMPDNDGIVPGSYRPTDFEPGDAMPAPAPPGPYGTALSVFNGVNPNGNWNLYIVDDATSDGGSIDGGWTLTLTTSRPVCCVGPGVLQFSAPAFSANEGTAGARITVTRTNGADGAVGVTFSTSDGTANAGFDYVATNETVTFASGDDQPKTVIIPQLDDTLDEDDETVNVHLSNVTGGAAIGSNANAVLTIVDNDPSPVLTVDDVSIAEGNSGTKVAVFTLSLSAISARQVSVSWATADGTATAGSDYVATSGTTLFTPGQTAHTVSVTINGDLANELDETFVLNLTAPVNATLARTQGIGTIVSDDILTVTSIVPTSGIASGGTNVTIAGTTFESGASVKFGTTAGTNVVVSGPAQITATTPNLAPGTLNDVVVTNANSISASLAGGFMADFTDVPASNPFHATVENIFRRGITAGCGSGNYCPDAAIARSQMAVFLLRAEHGQAYAPPPATGTVFVDVPANAFAAAFIEQLHAEGVTGGCATNPPQYCPGDPVTRAQMAVFLLRTSHGDTYVPPPATGIFGDVPVSHPFAAWIEALYQEGITAGCSSSPLLYCPNQSALRGQMAAFVATTFP